MSVPAQPSYVIDTSAILDLEGVNEATSYTDDAQVRQRVWRGLEEMIRQGRLVTVYAAKDEFKRKCPAVYQRLQPLSNAFFMPDSVALFEAVQAVLSHVEQLTLSRLSRRKPNRDPADPYIVALALLENRTVVTSEKHRRDRNPRCQRDERLPDICEVNGVPCLNLQRFVQAEGL